MLGELPKWIVLCRYDIDLIIFAKNLDVLFINFSKQKTWSHVHNFFITFGKTAWTNVYVFRKKT